MFVFSVDEIRVGFMNSEDENLMWTNYGRENLVGSGSKMENSAEKLKICMFGDGDIIGTTKKKRVKSRLLAA